MRAIVVCITARASEMPVQDAGPDLNISQIFPKFDPNRGLIVFPNRTLGFPKLSHDDSSGIPH